MTSHTHAVSSFDRDLDLEGRGRRVPQTLAALAVPQSGDVRGVRLQRADHVAVGAGASTGHGEAPTGFIFWVSLWLWFTLLFANFAEALAEGRGKAQAAALAQLAQGCDRQETGRTQARCRHRLHAVERAARGSLRAGGSERADSRRRRSSRGRRQRGRKRHHRRIRAGDPRIRRRSQCGHRRHARAVGLAGGAHHRAIQAKASSIA